MKLASVHEPSWPFRPIWGFLPAGSVRSIPAYMVFSTLLDQPNTFEHVCNVVNAPLLHGQLIHSHVEVQGLVGCPLQQRYEAQSERHEAVLFAAPLA